jgi:DNA-directed RNA polymerase specialized sigma24 family protein
MDATQSGLPPSVEPDQARPYVAEMLDALRRQREAFLVNRHRYVLLARKYGLTISEIAEYLGMSESGVRYVIDSADGAA